MGIKPRQRVYRILSNGSIAPFADVEFLSGGATLERTESGVVLYAGLSPYLAFAAPSGFLGRHQAQQAAATQQFPSSLKDWGDDHFVAYLFTRGLNLPGNLVFGDAPLQMEVELRNVKVTPLGEKVSHYQAMASALRGAVYGSSAGGEQPKFLAAVEDSGHVIVKFAKRGTRMAELLPLEHLALRSLSEVDIPAAKTQLLVSENFVFLEAKRFDRVGLVGRVGMLSAGSVDDEFFGKRDTWAEFAARCEQARYISPMDARHVEVMSAFSELIGNTDRHFENISLLIGEDGKYLGIAPAYDILPMRYASIGGGVDPDLTTIEPKVGTVGAKPAVWGAAWRAAERFWTAAQTEELAAPISLAMRELAKVNLEVARRFAAPLLPVAVGEPTKSSRR